MSIHLISKPQMNLLHKTTKPTKLTSFQGHTYSLPEESIDDAAAQAEDAARDYANRRRKGARLRSFDDASATDKERQAHADAMDWLLRTKRLKSGKG
jgi:hypothetical protein